MPPHQSLISQIDLEELFSHLQASVLLLDREGKVLYLTPSAERLFSVSLSFASQKKLPQVLKKSQGLHDLALEVLKNFRSIRVHEVDVVTKQGPLKLQVELCPIGNPEEPKGVLILIHELSILQTLQEENRVLDRLSMMGTIASGLAHEIRNPLGGIRGAAQMLLREESREENQEYLNIIVSEVDRLNHLMTELLNFSKPKKFKKSPVNINQILDELLIFHREAMKGRGIKSVHEFDPSLPPVLGHAESLKQAFFNLIKNALEAMNDGGSLLVRTSFLPHTRILIGEGPAGPMAQVEIQDTGKGISEEDLKNLFTPFFTTKPNGTGLGLMMTRRILKEHEGTIHVESEVDAGSTFRVLLKLATLLPKD